MNIDKLLLIDDPDLLIKSGISKIEVTYKRGFVMNIISKNFKKYRDIKIFDIYNWVIFKDGIIEILYNKGRCKIRFIE